MTNLTVRITDQQKEWLDSKPNSSALVRALLKHAMDSDMDVIIEERLVGPHLDSKKKQTQTLFLGPIANELLGVSND